MKFMHLSDVHLGAEPDMGKSWSKKRAQDLWDTFAETIERAAVTHTELLLISGDLFHRQPLKKELKEVNYLFEKIPETRIVLMAGNHDYMQPKSYYRTFSWAKNVSFFSMEEVRAFDFSEIGVTVYGMSYWHRELTERVYDSIRPENPQRINILLAHGGDEKHIPFSATQLLQNGFDYVAAGHIHKGSQMVADRAVMAGALEPVDCNDTGVHGYWQGEITKKAGHLETSVHFFPVKKCEYCHETLRIAGTITAYGLAEEIKRLLENRPSYQYFRIFLEGYIDPELELPLEELETGGRIVDITNHLVPNYSYERMYVEYADTILGKYIETMQGMPQDMRAKKALEYGVNALLGHRICR